MSSIFIWKANTPLVESSNTLRYYRGTDWFMNETHNDSISYQYITQTVNSDYILYEAKKMQMDWVGSDLLEIIDLPYICYKKDSIAECIQIGNWMQCIIFSNDNASLKGCDLWTWIHSWLSKANPTKKSNESKDMNKDFSNYQKKPYKQEKKFDKKNNKYFHDSNYSGKKIEVEKNINHLRGR